MYRASEGREASKYGDAVPYPLADLDADPVEGPLRHGVDGLPNEDFDHPPRIVSLSDIHGYVDSGRSSLLLPEDHPVLPPVVSADDDGDLHWAEENYVLVFNGDLIDRGPANVETLSLVARLIREAPPGRVRITLGNHEMAIFTPDLFGWRDAYSCLLADEDRRAFGDAIRAGHVIAAYEGYHVTFAHAGHPEPYAAAAANDELVAGAEQFQDLIGDPADEDGQADLVEDFPLVFGLGGVSGRGPGAGLVWLDFEYLPADAPPQVVGHSRHDRLIQQGTVVCQNVIRNNLGRDGGEAVVVETADQLIGLTRTADGGVSERTFDVTADE